MASPPATPPFQIGFHPVRSDAGGEPAGISTAPTLLRCETRPAPGALAFRKAKSDLPLFQGLLVERKPGRSTESSPPRSRWAGYRHSPARYCGQRAFQTAKNSPGVQRSEQCPDDRQAPGRVHRIGAWQHSSATDELNWAAPSPLERCSPEAADSLARRFLALAA